MAWWRPPAVFVSYRHKDSGVPASALYEHLEAQFGRDRVFFDDDRLQPGDELHAEIEEALRDCDVFVAVIGPQWLTLADANGPRLMQAGDSVRREVAQALAQRKRVIPVLVGGARLPRAEELPDDLRPLASRLALTLDDDDIRERGRKLVDAISPRPLVAIQWLQRRATLVGLLAALAMALAASVSLFDVFDTKAATWTLWLADAAAPPAVSDRLQVVAITPETERALDTPFRRNPAARQRHAALIDRLAEAGARTVAFDIAFPAASAADDPVLADAIRRAQARRTRVVLGAALQDGVPLMAPALAAARPAPAVLCIGERMGYAVLVPLASQGDGAGGDLETAEPPRSSAVGLALAAVTAGTAHIEPAWRAVTVADATQSIRHVPFSVLQRVAAGQPCRPGRAGDTVALAMHRRAPLADLRSAAVRIPYERVLRDMDAAALRARFAGKTVLVGLTLPDEDLFTLPAGWRDEMRHGLELHADAAGALLAGNVVQPLNRWGEWAALAALGVLGSRLRLWRPARAWRHRRTALLMLALAACVAIAVALCVAAGVLFNVSYAWGALLAGYALTARAAGGRSAGSPDDAPGAAAGPPVRSVS